MINYNKIKNILINFIFVVLISYILYLLYWKCSYKFRLKREFNKLKERGWNMVNYDILYLQKVKRKHIMNFKKLNNKVNKWRNRNAIGVLLDDSKFIVLDFDYKDTIQSPEEIRRMMPTNTIIEKTPNGYHYYFENDLQVPIHSVIQISYNDIKISLDILGRDHLIIVSPTCINNKEYKWINSPLNAEFAKLSNYRWIIDLMKNKKPFKKMFESVEFKVSLKNCLFIIDDINIENDLRFKFGNTKTYQSKMKLLDGMLYNFDDNYYFFTNESFNEIKYKKNIINELEKQINKLQIESIINLNIYYSNNIKKNKIVQINKCMVENYYNLSNLNGTYVSSDNVLIKTNFLTYEPLIIRKNNNEEIKDNRIYGGEGGYITMMLSNRMNLPCICMGIIINKNKEEIQNTSAQLTNYIFNHF